MTVASGGRAPKSVDALIVDDVGRVVARRTLTDRSSTQACLPLARAVGAWASLVLDAELAHVEDAKEVEPPVRMPTVVSASAPTERPVHEGSESGSPTVGASHPHSVELGTMVYLRNGMTTTGGIVGIAPFVTVELSTGWVLRPALFFGRSTSTISTDVAEPTMVSHVGARTDICRRIPGNYIERRGVELDLCAGVEGGIISTDTHSARQPNPARLGTGPSANLRGELGGGLALEVRGLAGVNVIQYAPQTPLVFASSELGLSMRLP
jgi:hypothetical protein